jgi:hypothetical protein
MSEVEVALVVWCGKSPAARSMGCLRSAREKAEWLSNIPRKVLRSPSGRGPERELRMIPPTDHNPPAQISRSLFGAEMAMCTARGGSIRPQTVTPSMHNIVVLWNNTTLPQSVCHLEPKAGGARICRFQNGNCQLEVSLDDHGGLCCGPELCNWKAVIPCTGVPCIRLRCTGSTHKVLMETSPTWFHRPIRASLGLE